MNMEERASKKFDLKQAAEDAAADEAHVELLAQDPEAGFRGAETVGNYQIEVSWSAAESQYLLIVNGVNELPLGQNPERARDLFDFAKSTAKWAKSEAELLEKAALWAKRMGEHRRRADNYSSVSGPEAQANRQAARRLTNRR